MQVNWQTSLKQAITDPQQLLDLLALDPQLLAPAQQAAALFPLRVPLSFVARMRKGDMTDPLLRQVLPLGYELEEVAGFVADPLAEKNANPLPGLLHKYHGRVLLTVTGTCGVNCRYCFRREFPYGDNKPGSQGWEKAIDYIAADTSIREVIFSGGDPLMATDTYLAKLVQNIAQIPHVTTLRIHTRMPIVMPERVTEELITWFTATRLHPVMVVHCNHANEINGAVHNAMQSLRQARVTLLNQSVLLKGVNDSVESLVHLSRTLFDSGVLPYYLHLLDRVRGAAHFEVSAAVAKQLIGEMTLLLPGYLVPKLVQEVPGMGAKQFVV